MKLRLKVDALLFVGATMVYNDLKAAYRKERGKTMKASLIFLWIFAALILIAGNSRLEAQTGTAGNSVNIRGKVTGLKGQDLSVAAPNGETRVMLSDKTIIRQELPMKFSEITSGMYLGTTAEKQSDGLFRASEVHVFSEDQRGTGEGHKPMPNGPTPASTMTNGNVERVEDVAMKDVKGRVMSVKYKDGEVKVIVPPDVPVIKRVVVNRDALKPGAEVSVTAAPGADGSMTATQITVRAGK
jgi:hypothetical protein